MSALFAQMIRYASWENAWFAMMKFGIVLPGMSKSRSSSVNWTKLGGLVGFVWRPAAIDLGCDRLELVSAKVSLRTGVPELGDLELETDRS